MTETLPDLDIKKYTYEIPDPVTFFEKFADSELGKEMRGRTRFHAFQNGVPNEKWIASAGPDTDNLLHMMETYKLTKDFLASSEGFSKKEKELLLFGSIVHDIGEVVDGDIPEPDRTEEQHEDEMRWLSGILEYQLREDMGEYERYNLIGDVVDVLSDKDSKLGKAFDAIEKLGYTMTALNSWRNYRMIKDNDKEGELKVGFRTLAHNVVIRSIPVLVDHSRQYSYVRSYLVQNDSYISDIMNDAGSSRECDEEQFRKAMSSWNEFGSSLAA